MFCSPVGRLLDCDVLRPTVSLIARACTMRLHLVVFAQKANLDAAYKLGSKPLHSHAVITCLIAADSSWKLNLLVACSVFSNSYCRLDLLSVHGSSHSI